MIKLVNSISISELSKEISDTIRSYSKEVELAVGKATEIVAKETVQELKENSPKRSGEYAKNWQRRKQSTTEQLIFQKDPTYRLTHLLENGHALKRGGRKVGTVPPKPHIGQAEERAIIALEGELMKRLNHK